MSQICRLCLECTKKKGVGIHYKDSNNFSVLTALNLVVPEFKIDCPKDSKICMQCYPLLLLSYKFRSKCLKTEDIITKYLKNYNYNPEGISLNQVVEWNRNCLIDNILEQVAENIDLPSDTPIKKGTKDLPFENNPSENIECKLPDSKPCSISNVPDKSKDAVSVRPLLKTYSKKNYFRLKAVHGKAPPAQTSEKMNARKTKIKRNIEQLEANNSSQETSENENTSYSIDKLISPIIEMDTEYPLMNVDFPKYYKKANTGGVIKRKRNKHNLDYTNLETSDIPTSGKKSKNKSIPPPVSVSFQKYLNEREEKSEKFDVVKKLQHQLKTLSKPDSDLRKPPSPNKSQHKRQTTVSSPNRKSLPVVRVRPVEVLNNLSLMSDVIQKFPLLNKKTESLKFPTTNTVGSDEPHDIENIKIKEEPVDYDKIACENSSVKQMPSVRTFSESSSSHCVETNQRSNKTERSNEQVVEGLINNLPEIGQEFDIPEYISINKVSYSDMAVLYEASTKTKRTKDRVPNKKTIANTNTLKRVRLVPIDHAKKHQIKKLRTEKPVENKKPKVCLKNTSADAEKDVCVLVTNFTSSGDYINDHDYLINPYERNKILPQVGGRSLCVCLLCNSAHDSEDHIQHMQTHSSVCEVCGVDFHNVFVLNIHVQTHTIVCGNCNTKISYKMHKSHTNCKPPSTSQVTNTTRPNRNSGNGATKESSSTQEVHEETEKPDDANSGLRRSNRLKRTKRKVYSINNKLIHRRQKYIAGNAREILKRADARQRTVIRKNNGQAISQNAMTEQYFFDTEQVSNRTNLPSTSTMVPKKVTWLQPVQFNTSMKVKRVKKCSPGANADLRIPELKYMLESNQGSGDKNIKKIVLSKASLNKVLEIADNQPDVASCKTGHITGFPIFMNQFKQYFRMNRSTFQNLMGKLYATIPTPSEYSYAALEKKVLVCLWYLGTTESLRSIGARFSSVPFTWESLFTIGFMAEDLNRKNGIISWPSEEQANNIMSEFEKISGVPGVIGCVKGLHIKIPAYRNTKVYIYNKMFHSVYLQGVCDNRKLFTDVYLSQMGGLHTATLFKKSNLVTKKSKYPFPNDSHIIGNKDFKLEKYLIVDYTENLDLQKNSFNQKLSQTRAVADEAFALLRGRFVRLKFMDTRKVDLILVIAKMACILHNICIQNGDKSDDILNVKKEMREMNLEYINPGPIEDDDEVSTEAEEKRHTLMSQLF